MREGRWCFTGGWFLQPDCNIPSGESFARHALISQNYFIEKFGKPAETGYNVDSFGHNGSLPKILRASRMNNYVFMRPAKHEKSLPANLFTWESADGSRVGAYRIPICYNICFKGKEDPVHVFGQVGEMAKSGDQMAFYGVGNHGGVVSVAVIKPLNLLLLGEQYARTMGLNVRRSRYLIFLSTTLLAGTVTAFCGPIGFYFYF